MGHTISVVVCTRNRPAAVARVVEQVWQQRWEGLDIVVVDQSEEPQAPTQDGIRYHVDPGCGLPRARNIGLGLATGDAVLFLDDDVYLHPGCLRAHHDVYLDSRVGGAVGRIHERVDLPNTRRPGLTIGIDGRAMVCLTGAVPSRVGSLKGANMSMRRVAALAAGGFDEGFGGTAFFEDADVATRIARMGWELWYAPNAAVDHLSEPLGGVRTVPEMAVWWRFHNTGRWLALHRGWPGLVAAWPSHAAIATRDAIHRRDLGRVRQLLSALRQGFNSAAST